MIALGYAGAVLVGFVLGLLGGGGSILTVPILVYLFEMPASLATTYSLFVVGITSVVGTYGYLRSGLVQFRSGARFLFPSLVGVWLSRRLLLPLIPTQILQTDAFLLTKDRLILLVFAIVMGLASYSMLAKRKATSSLSESAILMPLFGLLAGSLMGFVGAGGGFLIIPILVSLAKMEMKPAIGTSLFIITVSSLFGFAGDFLKGPVIDWRFLGLFSGLSILGVFLGAKASSKVPSSELKKMFGLLVASIATLMVAKELLFQ